MKKLLASLLLFLSTVSFSADKTMLVVPASPGGLIHRLSEGLTPLLEEAIGNPVYLEFKPGASGQVGAKFVSERPGPEITLLFGAAQRWTNTDFNQLNDLVPIAFIGVAPGIVVARPDAPFKTYKEFMEWSKTHPTAYGVPSSSAHPPLFREIHAKYGGQITEVFYKAGNAVMADVVGGHLPVGVTAVDGAMSFINDKRLIPLAVFSEGRSNLLPNVPTLLEQGLVTPNPNRYYNNLFLWANKSADPKVLEDFRAKFLKALASPEAKRFYLKADIQLGNKEPKNAVAILRSIIE